MHTHLNRVIKARSLDIPGGGPSHVAPETPGSIHEGGELGYSLAHACGAAFDNPQLIVACVIGDGEAETGPLAASWHSNKFLDPVHDGAVVPVLHLNGYKIANPTVLPASPRRNSTNCSGDTGTTRSTSAATNPKQCTAPWPLPWTRHSTASRRSRERPATVPATLPARASREGASGPPGLPRWPVIVLRTPKGWTGPKEVDGKPVENTWRSHQVPLPAVRENPDHLRQLEQWMRSYRPDELFDAAGRPRPQVLACVPEGDRRLGATPHANGGLLLRELPVPALENHAAGVDKPGTTLHEPTAVLGGLLAAVMKATAERRDFSASSARTRPPRTAWRRCTYPARHGRNRP